MEEEFPYPTPDSRCRLRFFENGLPGYSWYVPKTGQLKTKGDSLKNHWNRFVSRPGELGLIQNHVYRPAGHSYYLRQPVLQARRGNAFIIGDSAGLATLDLGEGISHAIRSGLPAAGAITTGSPFTMDTVPAYSFPPLLGIRH